MDLSRKNEQGKGLGMAGLEGRTALITGGAGPDMGQCLVKHCVDAGAQVVVVDANADNLKRLAQELPGITAVHADISDPSEVDRAIAAAPAPIDILFNHAGISEKISVVEEVTEADWERVMGVNLRAPFLFCKRVLPGMADRGYGVIVNTASVSGLRGARGGAAYTASKFGLVGLTQHIAATYGAYGIRCNAICPGGMGDKPKPDQRADHFTERGRQILTRDRDKPGLAPSEQVAAVAFYLVTDEAVRVNGAVIPVDGGWIAY
jgi:NAD(P)-dependent dehydrogenase (short-subunit alcohol dehydrogenase family)